MIKYLLLFVLPLSIYASKILSYNIYDRTDRVDVMITFDTPYSGVIKQSIGSSSITIKLEDASIESAKLKKLSSKYIRSLSITPMSQYTKITASVPSGIILQASKTADAYGLRLRFKTASAQTKQSNYANKSTNSLSSLPTKKDEDMTQTYYTVILILIIGIVILFYLKKKVTPNSKNKKANSSWLFKDNEGKTQSLNTQNNKIDSDVSIRFQKNIDTENSVVMLDFGEQSYLVLMGKTNILLDKYQENKPSSQSEFDTILQDRHKELDNFLNNEEVEDDGKKEPLQAYKERAAAILYDN